MLSSCLALLHPKKPLAVVGDILLDTYTIGQAQKISPEAPVPVLRVLEKKYVAGGAGNVALGVRALGAQVALVGRVGPDREAALLCRSLESFEVDTSNIVYEEGYRTIVKDRIISDGQQIVRVDEEMLTPCNNLTQERILSQIPSIVENSSAILLSDYGKGFLTDKILHAFIVEAKAKNIPVLADPKGVDFTKYKGVDLLKPNVKEAYAAANAEADIPLERVAASLLNEGFFRRLLITRSAEGMTLFSTSDKLYHVPADKREVRDVTGAGDTVLAVLGVAVAGGLSYEEAALLANIAGGIAVEHFGCYRVCLADLGRKLLQLHGESKIYAESHAWAVKESLQNKPVTLLGVYEKIDATLFEAIQSLSNPDRVLIVYVRTPQPAKTFVSFLTSLQQVHFVVLKEDSLRHFSEVLCPENTFVLQDGKVQTSPLIPV